MTDPISISLAAATFVSLAKDLVDIGKELTTFYKRVHNAPAIVESFAKELALLAKVLQKLGDAQLLDAANDLMKDTIEHLMIKIERLKTSVEELSRRRRFRSLATALNYDKLQDLRRDIESAMQIAAFAHSSLQLTILDQRFDLMALQAADSRNLSSQSSSVVQQLLRSGPQDHISSQCADEERAAAATNASHPRASGRYLRMLRFQIGARIWELASDSAYGPWGYVIHSRARISVHSPIVVAIDRGDVEQAQKLLALGEAHVNDWIYKEELSLLDRAVRSSERPLAMCQLILRNTYGSHDLHIIRSIMMRLHTSIELGLAASVNTSALCRLFIEATDIDMLLDWPDVPIKLYTTATAWYTMCGDLDIFSMLHSRQLQQAGSCQLRPAIDILLIDPCGPDSATPIALLIAHGIRWDNLKSQPQEIKNWVLHCAVYRRMKYHMCRHSTNILLRFISSRPQPNVVDVLHAGASPSSKVFGRTILQIIFELVAGYAAGMTTLSKCQEFLDLWLGDLRSLHTDLVQYARQEQTCVHLVATTSGLPSFTYCGHLVGYQGIEWSHQTESWQFSVCFAWSMHTWMRTGIPGGWPDSHLVPEYIAWKPASPSEAMSKWILSPRGVAVSVVTAMGSLPGLCGFGYRIDGVQDDHGQIARSVRRTSNLSPRHGRRGSSQPRSIRDVTWKILPDKNRPWLKYCHVGPFDAVRRLHFSGHHDVAFTEELMPCCCKMCGGDIFLLFQENLKRPLPPQCLAIRSDW